ncbi:heavy metal translocating P-type ATPase [Desulfosarcina variabilis str. Montpellier]|uniref:heavy metal translocating P-type ATPase n=1 Tax=Desulfosarcina variabilis TaxID=2300 RepID=UPI003AFB6413
MSSNVFFVRMIIAAGAVLGFSWHHFSNFKPPFWIGMGFYIVCFAMYARAMALAMVRTKRVTADLLVVTVMIATFLAGKPLGGALVAWFISLGLAVSLTIIEKTRRRIDALARETGRSVRVIRQEKIRVLAVDEVLPEDVAIVPQGEMIPVDGVIVEGSASVDESALTGEPFPQFRKTGDAVLSGAVCLSAPIKVRAEKAGDKGFLYLLAKEMRDAMTAKPKMHQTAERTTQVFISGVVLYAIGVFAVTWFFSGDAAAGLSRMAAVTAVACPCAWALSVPTAFAAAIGGLSRRGILAMGGVPLEAAGRIANVVLDKTGTVTTGRPTVAAIESFGSSRTELLRIAASVESQFSHPIAEAVVSLAAEKGVQPLKTEGAEYLPGLGVRARVGGQEVIIGTSETMAAMGIHIDSDLKIEGRPVWIGIDGVVAGVITIQDALREGAQSLGCALHDLGVDRVIMASGDNEDAEVRRVAARVNADDCRWGLTPAEKTSMVKTLRSQAPTLMMGDGVNDAVAMAAADVGVSIGRERAGLAVKSADILILPEDAAGLLTVIRTGKKLIRVIHQNLAWAVGFNTVGITLATAGLLSPWAAALVHHLSSVLVVTNSARLVRGESTPKRL